MKRERWREINNKSGKLRNKGGRSMQGSDRDREGRKER
jgi:hypothetical protein